MAMVSNNDRNNQPVETNENSPLTTSLEIPNIGLRKPNKAELVELLKQILPLPPVARKAVSF